MLNRGSWALLRTSVLLLVSAALVSALPLDAGAPGAAAVAMAVLAVVALGVVTAHRTGGVAGLAAVTARSRTAAPRTPSRQCDPDAAGHARPRAPGRG